MKIWLKRWIKLAFSGYVILAFGLVITQAQGNPRLRLVHASPGAPPADIYIDGNLVLRNQAFRDISEYIPLSAGEHTIRVVPAGQNSPVVLEPTRPFAPDKDYTFLVVGKVDNIQDWQIEDNTSAPDPNRALVRLVQASPDAPPLDICIAGQNICPFTNLAFKNSTGYQALDPGTYNIEVRRTGSNEVIGNASVRLDQGVIYSLFATGLVQGDPRFQLIPRIDTGRPPTQPPTTGAFLSPAAIGVLSAVLLALIGGLWLVRWYWTK